MKTTDYGSVVAVWLMSLKLKIFDDVSSKFPDLSVMTREISDIRVSQFDHKLEEFKEKVFANVRHRFNLENLKDEPIFRAYRDFFWSIGVDPTKTRPAAEALVRRVLGGRSIPRINTVVDAYNLASMTTCIALAAFDTDRLEGDLTLRFAQKGEEFFGIGMDAPTSLNGGEVIMTDSKRLIAVYPYRDADYSKINIRTRDLILISCGVPQISIDQLKEAADRASEYIFRYC